MANVNTDFLTKESLKEDNFSSHVHNIELLNEEIQDFKKESEFEIPNRYGIDTIKILPINAGRIYLYWEVTDAFIKEHNLITKIYTIEETGLNRIFEFGLFSDVGTYYLNYRTDMKQIISKIGYYNHDGEFIVLLESNIFTTPNSKIIISNEIVWMTIKEGVKEMISLKNEDAHMELSEIEFADSSKSLARKKTIIKETLAELSMQRENLSSGNLSSSSLSSSVLQKGI